MSDKTAIERIIANGEQLSILAPGIFLVTDWTEAAICEVVYPAVRCLGPLDWSSLQSATGRLVRATTDAEG